MRSAAYGVPAAPMFADPMRHFVPQPDPKTRIGSANIGAEDEMRFDEGEWV